LKSKNLLTTIAKWLGFVDCRSLNGGLQIAIFTAAVVTLPVILYHCVEAPFIAAGVKFSERLKPLPIFTQARGHAAKEAARICS
jgi:peptidoglycan/LPS O-acetylase OafA/YrhL